MGSTAVCFFCVLISGGLFYFGNPNELVVNGLGLCGWFLYLPLLICVKKAEIKKVWVFGLIYGAFSTGLFANWLFAYDALIWVVAVIVYAFSFALLFFLLKLSELLFEKNAWLVQFCLLCSYEYLKTLGFGGFHYGVTAYTQWKFIKLIQICDVFGVFGLNCLVIFPSCVIFCFWDKIVQAKRVKLKMEQDDSLFNCKTHLNYESQLEKKLKTYSLKLPIAFSVLWLVCFFACLIYGNIRVKSTEKTVAEIDKTITVAAVQNNENPKLDGLNVYRKNIQTLVNLTDMALEMNPEIDMVIWPETAVVPSIVYQYKTHKDENRYKLVSSLLEYMNSRSPCFVIGNGYKEISDTYSAKNNYNSALIFYPKKNVIPPAPEYYAKIHLVPFSEYFPYEKYFPVLYKKLLSYEHDMWTPGNEYKVFECEGLNFSTPICFEDTFPKTGREMFKAGARCFVNLSNDSWSASKACQFQHLSMAVFRSVENKIPTVRSTSSGQTCVVSSCGKIQSMCEEFCETYLVEKIPLIPQNQKPTLYVKIGDIWGYGILILTVFLLIMKIFIVIMRRK
ncbi:MAG: apolipoprotein N-acyltransferase [Treponema sp.]|nr:apolipoprotein N-acyltransferase [Treponema sp.]